MEEDATVFFNMNPEDVPGLEDAMRTVLEGGVPLCPACGEKTEVKIINKRTRDKLSSVDVQKYPVESKAWWDHINSLWVCVKCPVCCWPNEDMMNVLGA